MKKSKLNLIIDGILFILLAVMAGIGFLVRYVLVAGYRRNEIYGRDTELLFWGMDRHDWGKIHLLISLTFMAGVLIHIILHWRQITCIFKSMVRKAVAQWLVAGIFMVLLLVFAFSPFAVKPEIEPIAERHATEGRNKASFSDFSVENAKHRINNTGILPDPEYDHVKGKQGAKNQQKAAGEHHEEHDLEIYGYMTLEEVALQNGLIPGKLAIHIGIPVSEAGRSLGRLKRQYQFDMEDVRNYIRENKGPVQNE